MFVLYVCMFVCWMCLYICDYFLISFLFFSLFCFFFVQLITASRCESFKKGDIIVKEGQVSTKIYQIAKGACLVEKQDQQTKQSKQLGKMKHGEIFAEISFLEGIPTTASIIAESGMFWFLFILFSFIIFFFSKNIDETEVYVMEGENLEVLFFRQPALAGRFFQYLSTVLSSRLDKREQAEKQHK